MQADERSPRAVFEAIMADADRPRFGFGRRPGIVNVDLQRAYTELENFASAYETDPHQIAHVNRLSGLVRGLGLPVVWARTGYLAGGRENGVFGLRSAGGSGGDEPDDRFDLDPRLDVRAEVDAVYSKRAPSAFFGTPLASLLVWRGVDTVIVTGGSTSTCIRATVTDAVSHGFRTVVPPECVADPDGGRHYANLADMALKAADVERVADVAAWLEGLAG